MVTQRRVTTGLALETSSSDRSRSLRGLLWGGLLAGVLDLTYALVMPAMRGRSPIRVLYAIASGLLGTKASEGGLGTAALGVVLHFVIAFGAATVFYLASRKIAFLLRHAVVSGLLFGIAVYAVMQLVVLPLSAFPFELSYPPRVLIPGLLVHMFLVGLPISLLVRWFSR